jgi:hypothetical protein
LLCLSIHLHPSFSGPWTHHPAISFLVFLFVLLHKMKTIDGVSENDCPLGRHAMQTGIYVSLFHKNNGNFLLDHTVSHCSRQCSSTQIRYHNQFKVKR